MTRTRLSLFYVAGYLNLSGLMLLFAPTFSIKLLLSNSDYGDVFPRLAGMFLIGLGVLVIQIIRLPLEMLYKTTMAIRIFFCMCYIIFYSVYHDPFFLALLAVVGLGLLLTGSSYLMDKQSKSQPIRRRTIF